MLIFTRKFRESLVIDNTHLVTVLEIRGDKVRLGVQSPKQYPVHRREIAEQIYREAVAKGLNPPPVPQLAFTGDYPR
jgi:carbon storage regulator